GGPWLFSSRAAGMARAILSLNQFSNPFMAKAMKKNTVARWDPSKGPPTSTSRPVGAAINSRARNWNYVLGPPRFLESGVQNYALGYIYSTKGFLPGAITGPSEVSPGQPRTFADTTPLGWGRKDGRTGTEKAGGGGRFREHRPLCRGGVGRSPRLGAGRGRTPPAGPPRGVGPGRSR